MSDLLKGVLGGGWALLLGWIFPAGLSVGTFLLLVWPSLDGTQALQGLATRSVAPQSILVVGAAVALGVLFSAVQTPLYRVLEGYLLWPKRLAERSARRHIECWKGLSEKAAKASGYAAALAEERRRRYPDEEQDFVPTAFGNAIRRFEVYGWSRYRLNTQTLWYRIAAVAPESAMKAADTTRANVDFFVCLLYGHSLVGLVAAGALMTRAGGTARLLVALVLSIAVAAASYRLAIIATDEWASSVRAIADVVRVPLAEALGLVLPQTLEEERQMWRAVYWLDRSGYSHEASEYLSAYRRRDRKTEE